VAGQQCAEELQRLRGGRGRARGPAVGTDGTTQGRGEGAVRAGGTAAGTVGERGGPSADRQGPQQVGVQGQAVRVAAFGQRTQRTGEQQVLLGSGLTGDVGEPGGGLHHRGGGGVAGVVRAESAPVRGERLYLGDHVQTPADV